MKNADKPSRPCTGDAYADVTAFGNEQTSNGTGLTKREAFAMAAIQGMLSGGALINKNFSLEYIKDRSYFMADLMLEED
jgi:hypothetical protein